MVKLHCGRIKASASSTHYEVIENKKNPSNRNKGYMEVVFLTFNYTC